jgi:hypothetical protein
MITLAYLAALALAALAGGVLWAYWSLSALKRALWTA